MNYIPIPTGEELVTYETKDFSLVSFIVLGILYFVTIFIVLMVPWWKTDSEYIPTFGVYWTKQYGSLNRIKTTVFLALHTAIFLVAAALCYKRFYKFAVALLLMWCFIFMYYAPQQGAWNMVDYGDVRAPSAPARYIRFLALGDPQEFGNGDNRYANNRKAVELIRKHLQSFTDEDRPMGLLIPGDCTQTGEDGRYFTPNYLGDYEQRYALGTWESVPIQVYECTGNHDWDTYQHIYPRMALYFGEPPAVKMIRKRNQLRYGVSAQDDYGNYEWIWEAANGKRLIFLAINVWPSRSNLLSGEPDHSLDFLHSRLTYHDRDDARFILMTHYLPNPAAYQLTGGVQTPDFMYANTLRGTPCEALLDIFGTRLHQLKACIIGHFHLSHTREMTNEDGIRIFIVPAPAQERWNGAFGQFTYDTETDELTYTEL